MTDDTPERIYAWVYDDGERVHHNWSDAATYGALQTEYVRADLATPLNDPRVLALVEAAEGVEGRFCQAARAFHNTQFWSDEERDGQPLDDWVFSPIRAALDGVSDA
jgi:hypothetical protein